VARVFISHASQDLGRAQTVHDWLEADGHRIFLDHSPANGLEVGEDWKRRLYDELRQADAVVCIVTESFTRSVWCAAEVGIADCLGRRVLPIKYDDSKRHPLLSAFQYANFLKGEQEARAGLQRVLRRLDAAGRVGWREGSNPYPGLHPLTEETGAVFFGRGQETRDVAGLLRSAPSSAFLTLVAGASGAGKSSLIRAGVIPLLREDPRWLVLPNVVPGNDPVRTLARQLAVTGQHAPGTAATGRDWSVDAVHRALCSGDDGLRRIVEELLTSAGSGAEWALLPLDQAEELYVRGDDSNRGHLLRLLNEAGELLKTVGSIRSEFLDDLLGEPGIADTDVSVYPVKTLSPAMLRVIVEEPARVAGLRVPGELLARIIDDTGPGSALPLLAFTLNQLADGLERGDTLSPTVYDRLGGVHGAMARRADSALGEACSRTGLSDTAVLDKLTKLAAVDTDGRLSGRRLAISEFDTDAARALEVFVEHRLLSSAAEERGEQGQPGGERVIGVAHESLLSAWPPLRSGLETRMEAMRGARSVEEAAKDWDNAGRSASHLWEAERLAAVPAALTGAEANLLTQVAQDFLAACHDLAAARAARRRRNKVVVLSAFSLVTLIAVAAAVVFNTLRLQTEEAEQKAIARGMDAQAEAVAPADARLALQLAIAAHDLRPGTETKSALVSTTVSSGALQLGAPLSLKAPSLSSAFSGNGMKMSVASSDGKVRVWSLERSAAPRLRAVLSQEADADGQTLALTVDGSLLAAGSASDGLQLWRVAGPTPRRMGRVMSNSEAPKAMVFSPDGRTLAVGSAEGTVRLWDVRNPAEPRSLGGAGGPASSAVRILRFSPYACGIPRTSPGSRRH
jgi:TIR domain/WD domain, G-beta repeat